MTFNGKLSRSQLHRFNLANSKREENNLPPLSVAQYIQMIVKRNRFNSFRSRLTLGENEQRLSIEPFSNIPYDLLNQNQKNNGDIVNIKNPSQDDLERAAFAQSQKLRKDRIELKFRFFTINGGEIINIMPRDFNRNYLEIRAAVGNLSAFQAVFRSVDDVGSTVALIDAIPFTAGTVKEYNQKTPINAISIQNTSVADVLNGVIVWA